MTDWLAILALGFVLGMRHATDPDHVIAVTTIVVRYRAMRDAALIGIWWGVGHTLTVLLVGGGVVLLGWVIPPRLGLSMEFAVALMLIALGVMSIASVSRRVDARRAVEREAGGRIHSHAHRHGDYVHTHAHAHGPELHPHDPAMTPLARLDRRFGRLDIYQVLRPLVVGMVHGLAGSALVALLVMTAIRTPAGSVLYLLLFGAGTIAGMLLITVVISVPFTWTDRRFVRLNHGLRLASGVVSIAFGLLLAWQVSGVHGLHGPSPDWLPR